MEVWDLRYNILQVTVAGHNGKECERIFLVPKCPKGTLRFLA